MLLIVLTVIFAKPIPALASSTYTYDSAGRIATISSDNDNCVDYTYDASGNLVSVANVAVGTGTPTWGSASWGCSNWQAAGEMMRARRSAPAKKPASQK
jgi:YD repeat-containing protein